MIKPEDCKSYPEFHKRSRLPNLEASSIWMNWKLERWDTPSSPKISPGQEIEAKTGQSSLKHKIINTGANNLKIC